MYLVPLKWFIFQNNSTEDVIYKYIDSFYKLKFRFSRSVETNAIKWYYHITEHTVNYVQF